jgi:hypothetical protein
MTQPVGSGFCNPPILDLPAIEHGLDTLGAVDLR